MRLVDSSAWIEWLIGSPVGEIVAGHLPERAAWLVPTIVQLELAKWLTRECGEDKAEQVIAFTQVCGIAPSTHKSRSPLPGPVARTALQLRTPLSSPRSVHMMPTC